MRRAFTPVFVAVLAFAFLEFGLLFQGLSFHFWLQMTLTILLLCGLAWRLSPDDLQRSLRWPRREILLDIVIGLGSALLLYAVFFVGKWVAEHLFGFARQNIAAVYGFKGQTPAWLIGLLLGFIIGPGEELFWRGWVQAHLEKHLGLAGLGLSILAYAGVHLVSFNPMLILAAAVCGAFWGLLYALRRSLWANIISHTAWDLAVFLWFPFQS